MWKQEPGSRLALHRGEELLAPVASGGARHRLRHRVRHVLCGAQHLVPPCQAAARRASRCLPVTHDSVVCTYTLCSAA